MKQETKYKGVYHRSNLYVAKIFFNGAYITLGSYKTAKEAAKRYDEMSLILYGDFSKLNFQNKVKCDMCNCDSLAVKYDRRTGMNLCYTHWNVLCNNRYIPSYKRSLIDDGCPNKYRNVYNVFGKRTIVDCINKHNVKVGQFCIDSEDMELLRNHIWYITLNNKVVTNSKNLEGNNTTLNLGKFLLKLKSCNGVRVIHKNNDDFDFRKSNLERSNNGPVIQEYTQCVYKMANKSWKVDKTINGHRYIKCGFKTCRAAKDYLENLIESIKKGEKHD